MPNRQREVGINIRVTEAEKKKIQRNAKKCRLSVSEYLRQLAMGDEPKALLPVEIEQSLLRLQPIIANIEQEKLHESDPVSRARSAKTHTELLRVLVETIQMMRHMKLDTEETINGGN